MKITKRYLDETRELIDILQDMREQIEGLKDAAFSTTAAILDDVKVQTSGKKDRVGGFVTSYVSLEERYDKLANEYTDRVAAINKASKELPPKEQMIVIEYYVLGQEISEICRRIYVSERTAYRMKQSAVQRLSAA